MAYSAALHPFGFSQPTRVTTRTETRSATPIPTDDSNILVHPYCKSKIHHPSTSNDTLSLCPYSSTSPSYPRMTTRRSTIQRTFPDEEEDVIQPSRHERTREKRHPTRLQPSRHAKDSTIVSPIMPTTTKKLANLRISPEMPTSSEAFSERQLQEQIKEIYSALRRVEDEREKILSYMKAGRADQCRVERELEETRRENHRLTARLEEMVRSSKMKSPLSARSDDGWGCSMYDMETEGH